LFVCFFPFFFQQNIKNVIEPVSSTDPQVIRIATHPLSTPIPFFFIYVLARVFISLSKLIRLEFYVL